MIETENLTVEEATPTTPKQRKKMSVKQVSILVISLILIICCIQAVYQLTNSVSSTVMINSIYSAKGQNPDGTPFSIMEIFNDDIMNKTVEKLGNKISTQELRSHLSAHNSTIGDSFLKVEQSIFDGKNEDTYFPTEYILTYSTISEQIKNEGFWAQCKSLVRSIFLPSKTKILNALISSYKEYYAETYLSYSSLFEIDWTLVDSMDYYNRYKFMDDTAKRLIRFLQYKNNISMSQADANADNKYYDLIVELSKGPIHNIDSYQAYVTQNGVTNNKEDLLRQFIYMQKLSEEKNARKMQEYYVLRDAIEIYDSTTTKVVFIPALDENDAFYMNRTKVGLDHLSEKADNAKIEADSATHVAKHYSYLQSCFMEEYTVDENGNQKQIKNTPEQRAHADELYSNLKKEFQEFITEASLLTKDGKQTNQEDLNISNPFCNVSIIGIGMSFAKRFVLLSMAAYVVICITTMISNKKQNEHKEAKQ